MAPPGTPAVPVPAASTEALSDEQLVLRAKARDLAAFEVLVGRHEEKIYRLAMRLVRNESDAQEITQEAFLAAWRNLDGFEGKAQFGSWLYRVAANAALMHLRSARRRPAVSADVGASVLEAAARDGAGLGGRGDWANRPDEQLQSAELREHIQLAIDALPDTQRDVFLVRDIEGLSTEETAEVLGVTVPTVKTRLHRARLALRQAITQYFERS
jgi:RNA polymerase sigma-70 factor, ECF subfamily